MSNWELLVQKIIKENCLDLMRKAKKVNNYANKELTPMNEWRLNDSIYKFLVSSTWFLVKGGAIYWGIAPKLAGNYVRVCIEKIESENIRKEIEESINQRFNYGKIISD